jgi:transaldolase/glucose-6-phosphate isomerase
MDAFRDHGKIEPGAIEQDLAGAKTTLSELAERGVSLDEITRQLLEDGVRQFSEAFDKLFASLEKRRRILLDGQRPGVKIRSN